jgi:hypothetical protein
LECTFHIQDPTNKDTQYFYEAIVEQLMRNSLKSWRAIFAFATGNAVRNLFEYDPAVTGFLRRGGNVSIIVGLDAVTDVSALEELARIRDKENTVEGYSCLGYTDNQGGAWRPM